MYSGKNGYSQCNQENENYNGNSYFFPVLPYVPKIFFVHFYPLLLIINLNLEKDLGGKPLIRPEK